MNTPDAQDVHQSRWFDRAIRVGLVAYGVVHLMLGWLAAQIALGDTSESATNAGALHALAEQPFGGVMVWAVAIGMAVLVLWRILEAVYGQADAEDGEEWKGRVGAIFKAAVYGALSLSAVKVALGDGSSGGKDSLTARLMNLPGGQVLVGLVALAIIGYGGYTVYRGVAKKFLDNLSGSGRTGTTGRAYEVLGMVGHIAKGIAVGLVGCLFAYAAMTHKPKKSGGLDQALQTLRDQPFGPYALLAVAAGIACYGLYCFARARHMSR